MRDQLRHLLQVAYLPHGRAAARADWDWRVRPGIRLRRNSFRSADHRVRLATAPQSARRRPARPDHCDPRIVRELGRSAGERRDAAARRRGLVNQQQVGGSGSPKTVRFMTRFYQTMSSLHPDQELRASLKPRQQRRLGRTVPVAPRRAERPAGLPVCAVATWSSLRSTSPRSALITSPLTSPQPSCSPSRPQNRRRGGYDTAALGGGTGQLDAYRLPRRKNSISLRMRKIICSPHRRASAGVCCWRAWRRGRPDQPGAGLGPGGGRPAGVAPSGT
jgi:hypothetical protein